jgi:molecular chaperone DnaK
MYKATAASASAPTDGAAAAEEPKKDEGVIDAEYVDVDEKK